MITSKGLLKQNNVWKW